MTDRPIIFSASMVRALIDGRKTMTRRLACGWRKVRDPVERGNWLTAFRPTSWQCVKAGDRLWVRERWTHDAPDLKACRAAFEDASAGSGDVLPYGPYYFVGETAPETLKWISPIHMPRWASRLTLVVTATKIERVQRVSEGGALAEGVEHDEKYPTLFKLYHPLPGNAPGLMVSGFARNSFMSLWMRLHGSDSWDTNPEVVALTFVVHKLNIDELTEAA